jgi:hypothetical protein
LPIVSAESLFAHVASLDVQTVAAASRSTVWLCKVQEFGFAVALRVTASTDSMRPGRNFSIVEIVEIPAEKKLSPPVGTMIGNGCGLLYPSNTESLLLHDTRGTTAIHGGVRVSTVTDEDCEPAAFTVQVNELFMWRITTEPRETPALKMVGGLSASPSATIELIEPEAGSVSIVNSTPARLL